MAKLYDTIRYWANGQNKLDESHPDRRAALELAVGAAMGVLRHQRSLADLAVAYHLDQPSWRRIAEEFALSDEEAATTRDAAHWQRFMEIRHPRPARRAQ